MKYNGERTSPLFEVTINKKIPKLEVLFNGMLPDSVFASTTAKSFPYRNIGSNAVNFGDNPLNRGYGLINNVDSRVTFKANGHASLRTVKIVCLKREIGKIKQCSDGNLVQDEFRYQRRYNNHPVFLLPNENPSAYVGDYYSSIDHDNHVAEFGYSDESEYDSDDTDYGPDVDDFDPSYFRDI
ncbi:unnamed protein product [Ambrosiozyma monospora]|uniref:Unnamed protein product n=1 Tax=Ambrosiozyma monospora TaxID=43982 RepID=A0ACB5TIY1_AMBMO|nr:unnamed protein product [Ambrosiozyma monospora]